MMDSSERALPLHMRPDLIVERQSYLGRRCCVVKDPLAQKYYRFEEEEFALLQMLDGGTSLAEMQRRFERQFAPQRINGRELHQFLSLLHRCSLIVSDAPRQGAALLARADARSRQQRWASLTNVLSIRFKGWDPDRLLTRLNRWTGCFFSPVCVVFCLTLVLGALLLIGVQFDEFQRRLPAFDDFFASRNWIWLAVALAASKILHEFGHGLACKRFGGECHEMGVMLLVLTPCLYCNVSDSWMLPSKWRRAAIAAAGMYVELALASMATFVWWFTEPGLVNFLCLNLMFVCSVSTLLFNANPLLRYDGYYILADLVEIPNLRQKSTTIVQRALGAWLLGLPSSPDPFLPRRRLGFFAVYSVASAVYRWFVVCGILWFLYQVFRPYGLQVVGQLLVVLSLYALVMRPFVRLAKFFYVPGRMDRVNKPRLLISGVVAAAIVAAVFAIPLPHRVRCELYVRPREAASVYVETPGVVLRQHVRPGDWVGADQPLLTLDNVDVRLELLQLRGQRQQLASKLASLRHRAFEDEAAAAEIAAVVESLEGLDDQIARRERDSQRLEIAAPVQGCVIPPAPLTKPSRNDGQLPGWYGTPLEPRNVRAFLKEGVSVCLIGDPRRLEAILAIDQSDLEFVHPGQPVEIILAQLPGRKFQTHVAQLSQLDMKVVPRRLSSKAGGGLLTRTDESGRERPFTTTYQGSAPLDDDGGLLFVGATGRAEIETGTQTLARRAWRYLLQTFNLDI